MSWVNRALGALGTVIFCTVLSLPAQAADVRELIGSYWGGVPHAKYDMGQLNRDCLLYIVPSYAQNTRGQIAVEVKAGDGQFVIYNAGQALQKALDEGASSVVLEHSRKHEDLETVTQMKIQFNSEYPKRPTSVTGTQTTSALGDRSGLTRRFACEMRQLYHSDSIASDEPSLFNPSGE